MRVLNVGVFEHIETTYPMDVDQRVAYTQRILELSELKYYREVLVELRQSTKELVGDEWNLGKLTGLSADSFWVWAKIDTTGYDGYRYLAMYK